MPSVRCLLWDFGDTLCDERFIWSAGPEWMEIYRTFDDGGLGNAWNLGKIDTTQFAEELSSRLEYSTDYIVSFMEERCKHIEFYEYTFAFFQKRTLPQAIVTVNPDLFTQVISPTWNLENFCDVIITSWEEGTDDKRVLNQLAIEKMGLGCEFDEAVLIDNKKSNIDDWVGVGGSGYHFLGDEKFEADLKNGLDSLSISN